MIVPKRGWTNLKHQDGKGHSWVNPGPQCQRSGSPTCTGWVSLLCSQRRGTPPPALAPTLGRLGWRAQLVKCSSSTYGAQGTSQHNDKPGMVVLALRWGLGNQKCKVVLGFTVSLRPDWDYTTSCLNIKTPNLPEHPSTCWRGQRTTWRSHSFPSTMWVPGIKHRCLGLVTSAFSG